MSDLRAELGAALHTVVPGEPPVEAVLRQGRRIRLRRRVTAIAATAAVAVAVAAGYPALSGKGAASTPVPAAPRPGIMVIPAAAGSPKGLVATGTIGTLPWRLSISDDSPGAGRCIEATVGPDSVTGGCYGTGAFLTTPPDTSPATFEASTDGRYLAAVGAVAPDVTYLVVNLASAEQLKLIPVDRDGLRLVGLVLPAGLRATSVTAHLGGANHANGQVLTAVPFYPPDGGVPVLIRWSRPGQASPPTATRVIGTGTVNGQRWSATAYEGPWGTCVATSDGAGCWAGARPAGPYAALATPQLSISPRISVGWAAPSVASLTLTLTGGTSVRVSVVAVGNEHLWAAGHLPDVALKHWTAYSASGKQVASGTWS